MFITQVLFLIVFCNLTPRAVAMYDQCNASFVGVVNSLQTSWVAAQGDTSRQYPKAYGAKIDLEGLASIRLNRSRLVTPLRHIILPKSFDARLNWPLCKSIGHDLRVQGGCGSCWAMASAAVMTDRQCIHSDGRDIHRYSAVDLIAMSRSGCGGYYIVDAFKLWLEKGVVSSKCKPYQKWHLRGRWIESRDGKPACEPQYNMNYKLDKRYGKSIYQLSGETEIQAELYLNGPVVAGFEIYEDFECYKHGIYHHTFGNPDNYHAVKIIGWGEENQEKYWIVANSWGGGWGEKGFFRIRRGVDECGIESMAVVAGIPRRRLGL